MGQAELAFLSISFVLALVWLIAGTKHGAFQVVIAAIKAIAELAKDQDPLFRLTAALLIVGLGLAVLGGTLQFGEHALEFLWRAFALVRVASTTALTGGLSWRLFSSKLQVGTCSRGLACAPASARPFTARSRRHR